MNTKSHYWIVVFDRTLGLRLVKKDDIQPSFAILDIVESYTIIECERAIGFCLSYTLCQIFGSDIYDLLYNSPSSPMRLLYPGLSLQDTFRAFMADSCESNFCSTNKIGYWGYVLNASLYDIINESGFGESGFGFGADSGFHLIIVDVDELSRGLYIGFSPELQKPITADCVKEFMIRKLYDLISKASQCNSDVYQIINRHYAKDILLPNEDIITSAELRKLIDNDYDKVNKEVKSHFFDVHKVQKAVDWVRDNL